MAAAGDVILLGAGASFPFPLYERWAAQYRLETAVDVRYEPAGSGEGLRRIERGSVDFAGTDVPLLPSELLRRGLVQFPALVGAVVPVVNLHGLEPGELRLSGELLGDIFLGRIRRWSDPALREFNPTLRLPDAYITVVHRRDASGTSHVWSDYLSRHNAEWRARIGASMQPAWPLGEAGLGNEGAASLVQRTRSSIGYVEYAFARAHRLTVTAMRNRDGGWVVPELDSFRAAVESASWAQGEDLAPDFVDAPGLAAWPLTSASFVLMPATSLHPERSRAVLAFFEWAFEHGADIAQVHGYLPIPRSITSAIAALWRDRMLDAAGAPLWAR